MVAIVSPRLKRRDRVSLQRVLLLVAGGNGNAADDDDDLRFIDSPWLVCQFCVVNGVMRFRVSFDLSECDLRMNLFSSDFCLYTILIESDI
jgi:hypothetical protein